GDRALLLRTQAINRHQRLNAGPVLQHTRGHHGLRPDFAVRVSEERYHVRAGSRLSDLDERSQNVHSNFVVGVKRIGQLWDRIASPQHSQRADRRYPIITIVIPSRAFPQPAYDARVYVDIGLYYFVVVGVKKRIDKIPSP